MNLRPRAQATRREVISYIFIALAFVAIGIGFLGLQDTVNKINAEARARSAGECVTLEKAVAPLRSIIEFTTKPADLTGLTGDRLKVVSDLNETRLKARSELLPLIPNVNCRKAASG